MSLAPVSIFTYKRLDSLKHTIEALKKNCFSEEIELIIFSDAAIGDKDQKAVKDVRDYLKTINGFMKITVHEAQKNKGLANSIIEGVSQILTVHDSVIVLEDDLVSSPNFLTFMNDALKFYKEHDKVFSIAGYSPPIKYQSDCDVYFTQRASSWGWATWKDRWENIDWAVSDYYAFKTNRNQRKLFNRMGSDMSSMLDKQMKGQLDSWAIRWCYHQFKNDLYSAHPFISKIENIGFNSDATHTNERFNRFKTFLDTGEKRDFKFSLNIVIEPTIIRQFTRPFSIISRIKYKILNLI